MRTAVNADLAIVLGLLVAAVVMFARNKPRMDAVALIMLTALMMAVVSTLGAFMTPISSPVNTLVVAPGNYGFGDFIRIGVPFSILVMIVSVFLVPLLLPLHP